MCLHVPCNEDVLLLWNVRIWTGPHCQIRVAECPPRYRWSCFSSLGVRDRVWEPSSLAWQALSTMLGSVFYFLHHLVEILVSLHAC